MVRLSEWADEELYKTQRNQNNSFGLYYWSTVTLNVNILIYFTSSTGQARVFWIAHLYILFF